MQADLQSIIDAAVTEEHRRTIDQCARTADKAIMAIKTGTQEAREWTMADLRSMCALAAIDSIRALL